MTMELCKHWHFDEVLQKTCYQCLSESQRKEIESLREQLREQGNLKYGGVSAVKYEEAVKRGDEWKRRAKEAIQKLIMIQDWADGGYKYGQTNIKIFAKNCVVHLSEWFEENDDE